MKTFFIRLASGLTVAAVVISLMLWNQYSFGLVLAVMLIGSLNEFFSIMLRSGDEESLNIRLGLFLFLTCIRCFTPRIAIILIKIKTFKES